MNHIGSYMWESRFGGHWGSFGLELPGGGLGGGWGRLGLELSGSYWMGEEVWGDIWGDLGLSWGGCLGESWA